MTQTYFDYDKYSAAMKNAQEPMQALADLNMKTLQSFQYLKPDELSKIAKPEEFVEKQLEIAIANGHKALDYMQNSFQIIEKAMLALVKTSRDDIIKQ